jgi:hypothetical protein
LLLDVAFADLLHTHFIESSRRSDTCEALFGTREELISLTEHRSLLRLRQEHPRLLLHPQWQCGGRVVFFGRCKLVDEQCCDLRASHNSRRGECQDQLPCGPRKVGKWWRQLQKGPVAAKPGIEQITEANSSSPP